VLPDGNIEIVEAETGQEGWLKEAWQEEFPLGYVEPVGCSLRVFPKSVQKIIDRANDERSLTRRQEDAVAEYTGHYAIPEVGGYAIFDVCNQVGGRAYLPQGYVPLGCPLCEQEGRGREMEFLACLTNDKWHGIRLIYDGIYIEFWACRDCGCIVTWQRAE